jgi:hypothetical protein
MYGEIGRNYFHEGEIMRWPTLGLLTLFAFVSIADLGRADTADTKLTPQTLDALLLKELPDLAKTPLTDDEQFLRRVTFDLIGRQPTLEEMTAFQKDSAAGKRARVIDRLLASEEYGKHWANYWSDTISYRVPPPELTFLQYGSFKTWLAEHLNNNTHWDEIARHLLTASGPIKKDPAVTFIGYHQGNPVKLASETSRIFLGVQIECAQCHNHKQDVWKRRQFHSLAAFYARTSAKLGTVQDGSSTEIKDAGKGEYEMPHYSDPRQKGSVMTPTFLTGEELEPGLADLDRRTALAKFVTDGNNPWFARAYVNRIWGKLMRRGFYEPVDSLGDYQDPVLTNVHKALAAHFTASQFDMKDLFRLVLNSNAYQQADPIGLLFVKSSSPATHNKLSGDEVFQALVTGIGLPNITPPKMKATKEIRFPPPPKSTRDIVAEKFGYDPSLCPEEVSRNMSQAMLLMNNEQIQKQINADPKSGTLLSKLLQAERDDRKLFERLFRQLLARQPNQREIDIALAHIQRAPNRGTAFEDLVWALVNTAEFTTRK